MRRLKRFRAEEVAPPARDVLRRLELPADAPITSALGGLIRQARARFLDVADPLGVAEVISHEEMAVVYFGEGRNATESPLERVAADAEQLALFVATVGQQLSTDVAQAFVSGDPAYGLVLDAFASEGASQLACRLGADLQQALRARGDITPEAVVLPYSPGFCGWHVSGQRALFAALNTETIGVSLGRSCMMSPMKSIAGVFAAGPPSIHRFRPDYAFCADCTTRDCLARMAAVETA